jgi:hypothetical protein
MTFGAGEKAIKKKKEVHADRKRVEQYETTNRLTKDQIVVELWTAVTNFCWQALLTKDEPCRREFLWGLVFPGCLESPIPTFCATSAVSK